MKNRLAIVSIKKILVSMILIIYIFSAFPFSASATETTGATDVSSAGMEFIKGYEGFSSKVHSDSSHYYIGYGTTCSPNDYPNGITEEDAHNLLYQTIQRIGKSLNNFLNRYDITVNQNQYDALISFTYNLGTSWTGYTNRLRTCLIEGVENCSDLEIADAMAIWCHVGKNVNTQLLKRRICEARMFLYGDYGADDSPNFNYLILDPGDGKIVADVVLFESNKPYGTLPGAERDGYTFLGWYTDSGERIKIASIAEKNYSVEARWAKGFVEVPPDEPPIEVPPVEEPSDPDQEPPTGEEPPIQDPAENYSDIVPGAWYYTCVSGLIRDNVITGYPDGTFRPDNHTTYGEALKMIVISAGYGKKGSSGSHWASGYADFAVSEGLIEEGSIANLNEPISRLRVAQITAKALRLPESFLETPFTDTEDSYVLALYETGIIEGSVKDGTIVFLPKDNIKRSELSAIIWRINQSPDF